MDKKVIKEGKVTAIVSYLTFVGLLIAIFMNLESKNLFARFHIRQSLGLVLLLILTGNLISIVPNDYAMYAFYIFLIVLWIYAFSNALQEKITPIPLLGNAFQKWFTFIL